MKDNSQIFSQVSWQSNFLEAISVMCLLKYGHGDSSSGDSGHSTMMDAVAVWALGNTCCIAHALAVVRMKEKGRLKSFKLKKQC